MKPLNRAERVLALLTARWPGWVPAIELEAPGGRQAWRTAVAEARAIVKGNGDDIENRQRHVAANTEGGYWVLSEYRLKTKAEFDRESLVEESANRGPHDLNEWSLR